MSIMVPGRKGASRHAVCVNYSMACKKSERRYKSCRMSKANCQSPFHSKG
jgi:hypothetical protein